MIIKTVQYEIPPNPLYKDEINAFKAIKQIYYNNTTFYRFVRGNYKGFKPDEIEKK